MTTVYMWDEATLLTPKPRPRPERQRVLSKERRRLARVNQEQR